MSLGLAAAPRVPDADSADTTLDDANFFAHRSGTIRHAIPMTNASKLLIESFRVKQDIHLSGLAINCGSPLCTRGALFHRRQNNRYFSYIFVCSIFWRRKFWTSEPLECKQTVRNSTDIALQSSAIQTIDTREVLHDETRYVDNLSPPAQVISQVALQLCVD